jgi:hypothetical protein
VKFYGELALSQSQCANVCSISLEKTTKTLVNLVQIFAEAKK